MKKKKAKSCIDLSIGTEHRFRKTADKLFALHRILGQQKKKLFLIIMIFKLSLENILLETKMHEDHIVLPDSSVATYQQNQIFIS